MIPVAVPSYLVPKIADTDSITNKIQSNCSDCFDIVKGVIGEAEAERKTTLINGMAERNLGSHDQGTPSLLTILFSTTVLTSEHCKVLDTEDLIYRALSDRHVCFYPDKRRMKSFQNTHQYTTFQGPTPLLCVH